MNARSCFLFLGLVLAACSHDWEERPGPRVETPIGEEQAESIDESVEQVAAPQAQTENGSSAKPMDLPPPRDPCSGPSDRVLRMLVVGNSQIYFFDLPKIISDLSASAPPSCPRIAAEGFTKGGQNLMRLWNEGDARGRMLEDVLRDGKYDVVVIAECIDLVELPPPRTQFVTYAKKMIDAARKVGARPVLYATPYVHKGDGWGFFEMAEPQIELGRAEDVTVATGGLAWVRVWRELPSLWLHHVDRSHPGPKGSLISAMVIYATVTGASPIGLPAPAIGCYRGMCPESPVADAGELSIFQRAAWEEARAR